MYIVAEIMALPLENIKSMHIHKKVGFEKIGKIDYEDGTSRNVMVKKL